MSSSFNFKPIIKFIHKKNQLSKIEGIALLTSRFMQNPNHRWAAQNPRLCKVFELFFNCFPEKAVSHFLQKEELIFINHSGTHGLTYFSHPEKHLVLIFPDVIQYFHSPLPTLGLAVVAHEVGHIYFEHYRKKMDPLEAQIEADYFAYMLGLGGDLYSVLEEEQEVNPSSSEIEIRLENIAHWMDSQNTSHVSMPHVILKNKNL